MEPEFSDGVWLIDLAPLVDATLVSQTVASTVWIVEESGRAALDALTEFL